MKKILEYVCLWVFVFALIFFDAWCNMVVYNTGICPLLVSLQIYPPALGYGFFLMLTIVIAYLLKGKKKEIIQLNTAEGWSKVLNLVIDKLCYIGLIVLFNVIIF